MLGLGLGVAGLAALLAAGRLCLAGPARRAAALALLAAVLPAGPAVVAGTAAAKVAGIAGGKVAVLSGFRTSPPCPCGAPRSMKTRSEPE